MRRLCFVISVLLLLGTAPAAALAATHWTGVPFPDDLWSGWVEDTDTGELEVVGGVIEIARDSAGDVWGVTRHKDDSPIAVVVLRKGANGWERAEDGIAADYSGEMNVTDLYAIGDEIFLRASSGLYSRTPDDDSWQLRAETDWDMGLFLTEFAGELWIYDLGEVGRFDAGSGQMVYMTEGLPEKVDSSGWGNNCVAANSEYLYVGLYGSSSSDPDFSRVGLYRLGRGQSSFEKTDLPIVAPSEWTTATGVAGVHELFATDGYAVVHATNGDEWDETFVYDEADDSWTEVPEPPQSSDGFIFIGDDPAGEAGVRFADGKMYVPQWNTQGPEGVEELVLDLDSAMWDGSNQVAAYPWDPYYGALVYVGDDLIFRPARPGMKRGVPPEPTGFVKSVPLPTEVSRDPKVVGTNLVLAALFAGAFGFTSALFNGTLKENAARINGWFAPLGRLLGRARRPATRAAATGDESATSPASRIAAARHWLEPVAVVLAAALIYGFLDPDFSLSVQGLALFLSLALSIGVVTAAYDGLQSFVARRGYKAKAAVRFLPGALLVAVVCVWLSRMFSFHPGYLYGLVGAMVFLDAEPDEKAQGRLILTTAVVLLGVSVAAWWLAVPVTKAMGSSTAFGWQVLNGTLVGVFVTGLEGLLFGLVPLQFLDGEKVMRWSKTAWAITFGLVSFAFWHVFINKNSPYTSSLAQKNVQVMAGLLVFYAALSVATWALFRSLNRRGPAPVPVPMPGPQPAGAQPVAPPVTAAPASPGASARFCPGCGAPVSEGAAFCPGCGGALPAIAPEA